MSKIIRSYDVKGKYVFDEADGTQEGKIYLLDDKKISGMLEDHNQIGAPRTPKFVFGVHNVKDELLFWKIAPADRTICPVLWYLKGDDNIKEEDLNKKYTGHFGLMSLIEMDDPFELTMFERSQIEELRELGGESDIMKQFLNIRYNQLFDAYFPKSLLESLEKAGKNGDSKGSLVLTEMK
jgi:hypothetical protein